MYFSSPPPSSPDSKRINNYWCRPGEEKKLKIQLRECNRTQQEEVESRKQENWAGCGSGVGRDLMVATFIKTILGS